MMKRIIERIKSKLIKSFKGFLLLSIVVTEYALLQMKNESDVNIWSGISGMGVSVIILAHGILMVIRSRRYNKN